MARPRQTDRTPYVRQRWADDGAARRRSRGARSLSEWRVSGRSDRAPYGRRGWAESDAARRRFRGARR